MISEFLVFGLIALAASSILIEQLAWRRPRPVPLLIMDDDRQRRAAERLFAERGSARRDSMR